MGCTSCNTGPSHANPRPKWWCDRSDRVSELVSDFKFPKKDNIDSPESKEDPKIWCSLSIVVQ